MTLTLSQASDLPAPAFVVRPSRSLVDPDTLDAMITAVDAAISEQLDVILHHPAFQRLEATWRGLAYLVHRVEPGQNVEIAFIPCTVEELRRDFAEATTPLESGLFRVLQAEGFAGPEGRPYAAMIADLEIGPEPADIALLRRAAAVGEALHAPFIAAASPAFLGLASFADLAHLGDLRQPLSRPELAAFAELRRQDAAGGAALVLPRVLMRAPHEPDARASFAYREGVADRTSYLWGSAVHAFAGRLVESFVRYGWCPNIIGARGGGAVDDLPVATGPNGESIGPVESVIGERAEHLLAQAGFIPLARDPETGGACFTSAPSLREPRYYGETEEGRSYAFNDYLGAQLPYLFMTNRLAHYAKALHAVHREAWSDARDAEKELNDFFGQYVAGREVLPAGMRSRGLLRKFRMSVEGSEDSAAWQRFVIQVRPLFKHHGAFFTLRVEGRLDTR